MVLISTLHLTTGRYPSRATSIQSTLGRPTRALLEIVTPEPLDPEDLLGAPARVEITGARGSTGIHHGVITSLSATATADPNAARVYEVEVQSAIAFLDHRKDARVFRKKNAVATIQEVLDGGGVRGAAFINETLPPPEREYVTQWNETDATFLRRICEEEGLYFRFDPQDGFDALVLCDRSSDAPTVLESPLVQ